MTYAQRRMLCTVVAAVLPACTDEDTSDGSTADASAVLDGGTREDGGRWDGGVIDASRMDAGNGDAAPADAGAQDAGMRDAGMQDGGPSGPGHVVYRSAVDDHLYRIEASPGAAPQDLSAGLDALSVGPDFWVNVSFNAQWLLISTERFGCTGWACAVRVRADLSQAERVILPTGEGIHPEFSAISDDGALVVYPEEGGAGTQLYATRRGANQWGAPQLLTAMSPHAFNLLPALSADGTHIMFSCGSTAYAQQNTGICEVAVDGSSYFQVLAPADGPGGTALSSLHSADYAPWGGIVFEADWAGEQVWQLNGGTPTLMNGALGDDNSPCALPGSVASLWLDRPGATGVHELKIMQPNGTFFILVSNQDIWDIGIGCSR